ncbi:MAG TPA: MFS transporter [Bauldia sp.]
MTDTSDRFVRNPATWYGYFLIGTQIYLFNVQGNVIPFLQEEFSLSYRVVSLHSSAIALGVILTGLFGRRVSARLGRRYSLWLGGCGIALGGLLLCLSPGPWASIASCFIMGLLGAFLPAVVPAALSDMHGEMRRQAFAEQAIVAYGCAIIGPLATGGFIAWGLGWRPAVVLGCLLGIGLTIVFRNVALAEPQVHAGPTTAKLPPAFWAYWFLIVFACSLEFSVLLWSPTFLERVAGFTPANAATVAAGFFVGVLIGRIALRALVTRYSPRTILFSAFATGAIGFVLYWIVGQQWAAIVGIVLLGLCIAPQYPLTMALGLGVAAGANDAASARMTLAFGLALLIAPAALGALADVVGLRLAHLTLPALIAAELVSFLAALALSRRATPIPSQSAA